MPQFERYIGIDYSGAVTPESSCKGLRAYVAEGLHADWGYIKGPKCGRLSEYVNQPATGV